MEQVAQTGTAGISLGKPIAYYAPSKSGQTLSIVGALICFAIAIGVGYVGYTTSLASDAKIGYYVVAGGAAVFGLAAFWSFINNRGLNVTVHEQGLLHTKGAKVEVCRWDDISAVWQSITKHYRNGVYTGTTYLYTVHYNGTNKLTFTNNLQKVEELGTTIQNEVSKRLFPRQAAAYNRGEPVTFGKITLDSQGVKHGKKSVPWAEIEGVQINNGYIRFKKQGNWFNWANVPVAQIPNLFVFLTLVDHIVGIKRK